MNSQFENGNDQENCVIWGMAGIKQWQHERYISISAMRLSLNWIYAMFTHFTVLIHRRLPKCATKKFATEASLLFEAESEAISATPFDSFFSALNQFLSYHQAAQIYVNGKYVLNPIRFLR